MLSFILLATVFASLVAANAEKVIFLGPAAVSIPLAKPTLSDLNLLTLSPNASSIRTNLSRVFPDDAVEGQRKGHSTWLLLDNLTEGQRYELRVCWAATEPTAFSMEVYQLSRVWETPELMVSLANYAYARLPEPNLEPRNEDGERQNLHKGDILEERTASIMLLHIQAAADYFSYDANLMKDPPPVLTDLILDPYIVNVLPRSLLPTVGYIIVVAVFTWFVARWVTASLLSVATEPIPDNSKKTR
ncbi:hypothetical protein NLU13_6422 [Sarocladium strictum]|uniref:Uncharacterized protein n=1 Tax=Sarocladium strictum TaxID=5046 RepID=A0AA39GFV4_SARSR|nr:hypothetical protein NLU13_6422 [Sarocladium strictum]